MNEWNQKKRNKCLFCATNATTQLFGWSTSYASYTETPATLHPPESASPYKTTNTIHTPSSQNPMQHGLAGPLALTCTVCHTPPFHRPAHPSNTTHPPPQRIDPRTRRAHAGPAFPPCRRLFTSTQWPRNRWKTLVPSAPPANKMHAHMSGQLGPSGLD